MISKISFLFVLLLYGQLSLAQNSKEITPEDVQKFIDYIKDEIKVNSDGFVTQGGTNTCSMASLANANWVHHKGALKDFMVRKEIEPTAKNGLSAGGILGSMLICLQRKVGIKKLAKYMIKGVTKMEKADILYCKKQVMGIIGVDETLESSASDSTSTDQLISCYRKPSQNTILEPQIEESTVPSSLNLASGIDLPAPMAAQAGSTGSKFNFKKEMKKVGEKKLMTITMRISPRIITPPGSPEYHDLAVLKAKKGPPHIIKVFDSATGETVEFKFDDKGVNQDPNSRYDLVNDMTFVK